MLCAPAVALAYESPEDVLFSPQFAAPPSARNADARAEAQNELSAQRRAEQQAAMHAAAQDEVPDNNTETVDPADAPSDNLSVKEILQQLLDEKNRAAAPDPIHESAPEPTAPASADALRDARIEARIREAQMNGTLATGNTLHSGAPLNASGPGLIIGGTALLAGALWTMRRSSKAQASTLPL